MSFSKMVELLQNKDKGYIILVSIDTRKIRRKWENSNISDF